ncbi:MAG: S8 family serine peptidase [Chitinispirillaceae bacterium]|nr:S8 family serine peptidase [Chitinispirillaceae bacterium]
MKRSFKIFRNRFFFYATLLLMGVFVADAIPQNLSNNGKFVRQPFLEILRKHGTSENFKGKEIKTFYLEKYRSKSGEDVVAASLVAKFRDVQSARRMILSNGGEVSCVAGNTLYFVFPLDSIGQLASYNNFASQVFPNIPSYPVLSSSRKNLNIDILENMNVIISGVPTSELNRGQDVIVGIIDDGFLATHKTFRNRNDSTRILFLRDQTSLVSTNWVEYNRDSIQKWSTTPSQLIGSGHGTHVASIAAGSGLTGTTPPLSRGQYPGIASEADIIMVKTNGYLDNIIAGVSYIIRKADSLGKRAVINISYGSKYGPKDNTSDFNQMLNDTINAYSTIIGAVAISAGNYRNDSMHAFGNTITLRTDTLIFRMPDSVKYVLIDMWYNQTDSIDFRLAAPNGNRTNFSQYGDFGTDYGFGGTEVVTTSNADGSDYAGISDSNTARRCRFYWRDTSTTTNISLQRGLCTLIVHGRNIATTSNGSYNIWLAAGKITGREAIVPFVAISKTGVVCPDSTITISDMACTERAITVAAHNDTSGIIAPFSSMGPTRIALTFQKPDISAPGVFIRGADTAGNASYNITYSGTSQASPHVAGAIALLLQEKPNLTAAQIKAKITEVNNFAIRDAYTTSSPNHDLWGEGKMRPSIAGQFTDSVLITNANREIFLRQGPDFEVDMNDKYFRLSQTNSRLMVDSGALFTSGAALMRRSNGEIRAIEPSIEKAVNITAVNSNETIEIVKGKNDYTINKEANISGSSLTGVTLKFNIGCTVHVNNSVVLPSDPDKPMTDPINTNKIEGSLNVTLIPPIAIYNSYKSNTGNVVALVNEVDSIDAKAKDGQTAAIQPFDSSGSYSSIHPFLLTDVSLVGEIIGGRKPKIVFTDTAVISNQKGILLKDVIFESQQTRQDTILTRFRRFGSTATGAVANSEINGVDYINTSDPDKSRALEIEYRAGTFRLISCNFVDFYIPIDAGFPHGIIPTDSSRPVIEYCDWSTCVQGPRGVSASSPSDVFKDLSYCNFGVSPAPYLRYGFQQNPFEVNDKDSVALYTAANNRFEPPAYVDVMAKDLRLSPNTARDIDVDTLGNDIGSEIYTTCQFPNFISPTITIKGSMEVISLTRNDLGAAASVVERTTSSLNPIIEIKIKKNLLGQDLSVQMERRSGYAISPAPANLKIATVTTNGYELSRFCYNEIPTAGQSVIKNVIIDSTPPIMPANFTATVANNDVVLSWSASNAPDAMRYKIYRAGGPTVQIASLDKSITQYIDSGAASLGAKYSIVAYDSIGNESIRGEAVSAVCIYVDDDGSDSTGDGSLQNPFATIGKAVSRLPDTPANSYIISIFPGEYEEHVELKNANRVWTATKQLSFRPRYNIPDSMPLWRGPEIFLTEHLRKWGMPFVYPNFMKSECLSIENEDYVTVEGIRFAAALPQDSAGECCGWPWKHGKHFRHRHDIRHCNKPSITETAVSIGYGADHSAISRCFFLGEKMRRLYTGIECSSSADSLKIENSIFYGLSDGAVRAGGGSKAGSGPMIVNNTFYQCGSAVALEGGLGRVCHADSSGSTVFANNVVMKASSAFVFSGPFWRKNGRTTMTVSNCDFYELSKDIVLPPYFSKHIAFTDTLMRNPLFTSTDVEKFGSSDFMKPMLPAVAGGGLSAAFTPTVDFFNKTRDVPVSMGAVEGTQPAGGEGLAKRTLASAGGVRLPMEFGLSQSYPNPFRQMANIRFQIPGTERVRICIEILRFDGRVVKTLINDERSPGYYQVAWDGRGNSQEALPSGSYLYRIRAGSFHDVKRMVLMR